MAQGVQNGGGRMGGVGLGASTLITQTFRNMPEGPIKELYLTINVSLKSTDAAFAAVVSTDRTAATEGTDDLDIIANALFSSLTLYWNTGNLAFSLTPAQLRTILGLLNQHDVQGTFVNGSSIPISSGSATAYTITYSIPVGLQKYFQDGATFMNGSTRLKSGQLDYMCGSSLTPTVTLANGSAVVSGVSVSLTTLNGTGSANDVGPTWRAVAQSGLPSIYEFEPATYLAILDRTPVATNTVTNYSIGPFTLWSPANFGANYQGNRITIGGYDVTDRVTPLLWVEPGRKLTDFVATLGIAPRIEALGATTLNVYTVRVVEVAASEVEAVATAVAGGGQVTTTRPTPPSLPPGSQLPMALSGLVQRRLTPGTVSAPSGVADTSANPQQAAAKKAVETVRTGGALSVLRRTQGS